MIVRRAARRLAAEACAADEVDAASDVLAQVQAEATATWRSPAKRQADRARAECLRACTRASRCTPA